MADQRSRRRRIAGESRPGQAEDPAAPAAEIETPAPEAPAAPRPKVSRPRRRPRAEEPAAPAATSPATTNDDEPENGDDADDGGGADVVSPSPDAPVEPADDRATVLTKPARTRTTLTTVLTVAAALAVVFAVVGVVLGVRVWSGERGIDSAQSQATEAAATDVELIFTYDYDKIDEHLSDAKEQMTPAFAKEFDSIAPALTDLAPQRKIQIKATSREAAPVPCGDDCSDDRAQVTVFFDQARLADGATQPTVFGNRVLVSMAKQDGGWKVSDIKAL